MGAVVASDAQDLLEIEGRAWSPGPQADPAISRRTAVVLLSIRDLSA